MKPLLKSLPGIIGVISLIFAILGWLLFDRGIETAISLLLGISAFVASLWAFEKPISQYILTTQFLLFRKRLIQKVKSTWIVNVLINAVNRNQQLNLFYIFNNQKEEQKQSGSNALHDLNDLIGDFESSEGVLLISGKAGGGKTFCLLSLCNTLLRKAEEEKDFPIPVVLNLSSWASKRVGIAKWLITELKSVYGIPESITEEWVDRDLLTLMLDGLDEVEGEYQYQCMQEINMFRKMHPLAEVVVCCREENYEILEGNIDFSFHMRLQPLEHSEIRNYLSKLGKQGKKLLSFLEKDSALLSFVSTPLTLTLIGSSLDRSSSKKRLSGDDRRIQDKVVANYIDSRLDKIEVNQTKKMEVFKWLSWIATMMKRHNQTVFTINSFQPNWLETRQDRIMYLFGADVVNAILIGLFTGPLFMLFLASSSNQQYFSINHFHLSYYLDSLVASFVAHNYQDTFLLVILSISTLFMFMAEGVFYVGFFVFFSGLHLKFRSFAERADERARTSTPKRIPFLENLGRMIRNAKFVQNLRTRINQRPVDFEMDPLTGIGIRFISSVDFSFPNIWAGIFAGFLLFALFVVFQFVFSGLSIGRWNVYQIPIMIDKRFLIYSIVGSIGLGLLSAISLHNKYPSLKASTPRNSRFSILFSQRLYHFIDEVLSFGIGIGIVSGIIVGYISSYFGDIPSAILWGTAAGLSLGFGCFWFLGGQSASRHIVLRTILAYKKLTPWNYEKSIESISKTNIIIDLGNGFIFAHPLIQEYLQVANVRDHFEMEK